MYIRFLSILFILFTVSATSCRNTYRLSLPPRPQQAISGTAFYKEVDSLDWKEREAVALKEILSGNVPAFLRKFVPIHSSITGSDGRKITATWYVAPDYLAIGDKDFARIPLTPMTAQQIADSLQCFLP